MICFLIILTIYHCKPAILIIFLNLLYIYFCENSLNWKTTSLKTKFSNAIKIEKLLLSLFNDILDSFFWIFLLNVAY